MNDIKTGFFKHRLREIFSDGQYPDKEQEMLYWQIFCDGAAFQQDLDGNSEE